MDNIVDLIAALKLTPRQIQEVFRILGHLLDTSEENKGRLMWCFGVGSIAMAVFKVGNPDVFRLLGSQQFNPNEAFEFLTKLLGDKHVEWWFALFLTGKGLKGGVSDKSMILEAGFNKAKQDSSTFKDLGQFYRGWESGLLGGFVQIHERIEQISQWN